MTALDIELTAIAAQIDSLSKRSQVALFWACSSALTSGFQTWAEIRGVQTESILLDALGAARQFAIEGIEPLNALALLTAIEAATPIGESPDKFSSTFDQECWICADVCVRVFVEKSYFAGSAIEYALEPTLSTATQELYGVSQLGTSQEEEAQVRILLQHPKVVAALDFCRWAV